MNFFQSQDDARKNTKKLVFLFSLAVICLILLTNLFLLSLFVYLEGSVVTMESFTERFDLNLFLIVGTGVTALVVISSVFKIISLSGGGSKIMSYMNAELIIHDSGDSNKQKILNVVEEMAIASGTPVPQVYLLNESGINAFAAGFTIRDATIGITSGAIEQLSRGELQGVIAHEFSHIINGDMRLNIKLIGILHGILVIGLIGQFLMYSSRHRSNSKNNNFALGLGLMAIGYAGTFFGNWIKAAVSRQREYLADASAVQFTRNPDGIAGALIKIGGFSTGSHISNPKSSEISHTFFCEGVTVYLKSMFATHPPLDVRIKKILPSWDGNFVISETFTKTKSTSHKADEHNVISGLVASSSMIDKLISDIGRPTEQNMKQAKVLIHEMPTILYQSAHEPHGARAVIYYLLLSSDNSIRQKQLKYCSENSDDGVYHELNKMVAQVSDIDVQYRLAIVDITLPALAQLSNRQKDLFITNFLALVKIDNKISVFEWVLQKIIFTNFNDSYQNIKENLSLNSLIEECSIVLSLLLYVDADKDIAVRDFFPKISSVLNIKINLVDKNDINLKSFDLALTKLKRLKPLLKPQLLKACALAINADRKITHSQLELYRAISVMLDCPMPIINQFID